MRDLVLAVLEILEQMSLSERQEVHSSAKARRNVETAIEEVRQEIADIREKSEEMKKESLSGERELPDDSVIVERSKLESLESKAVSIDEFFHGYVDASEEEKEIYDHLVGVGLSAERFVHELDRMINGAVRANQKLRNGYARERREALDYLDVFCKAITNETRLLGALRYLRRGEKPRTIQVYHDVVELVEAVYREDLRKARIAYTVKGNDFEVRIPRSSLTQVVDNIFANAVYWLKQKSAETDRRMFVELDPEARTILIGNNGAEIAKHVERHLFNRPFVTTKPDGHGLGMYIAGRIMERGGGSIRVVKPDHDPRVKAGIAFEIRLKDQGHE